jgi:hypothetical protein
MSTIPAPGRGGAVDARELIGLSWDSGSSSLKLGVYRVGPTHVELLIFGQSDSVGGSKARFHPFPTKATMKGRSPCKLNY